MKKILYLLMAASAAGFVSCSDDLDAKQTNMLPQDRYDEMVEEDADKMLSSKVAGVQSDIQYWYYTQSSHNYFGQKGLDYRTALMGNDLVMTNRYAMSWWDHVIDYRDYDLVATSNVWRGYYRIITTANEILTSIPEDATSPSVLKYKATALGLRGYAYLYLTYFYQYAYKVGVADNQWGVGGKGDYSQELGVPDVTEQSEGNQPRATLAKNYERITGDLEESCRIFEQIGMTKTADPTDFDGCVSATYLYRAYLAMQDWTNAAKYAKVVMDNFGVLNTEADILQGFSSISLSDVVYGCDITSDNTSIYASWFSQMDMFGDGYAGIGVSRVAFKPLVDRISDSDIRLDWFWAHRNFNKLLTEFGGMPESLTHYYQSAKFVGAGRSNVVNGYGEGWELGDYIYLRSEEAYLSYAEAMIQQGGTSLTEGRNVLNSFMQTRDPNYNCTLTDKAALVEELIFQKRVEFWGEGLEYIDNRRLNIPVDRTDATWGADNNHYVSAKMRVEQTDLPFLYQLPAAEIDNNPEIGQDNQNP